MAFSRPPEAAQRAASGGPSPSSAWVVSTQVVVDADWQGENRCSCRVLGEDQVRPGADQDGEKEKG